jgi:hypothetical protein
MRRRRRQERGQGVVEFAVLVPAFMIVLFGMLEFGFAFAHHLTLEYATREGARVGAALANGTATVLCAPNTLENVDDLVVAAVQRVITSPGSQVPPGQVKEIHIYKATSTGAESGSVNIWVPGSDGRKVDNVLLQFTPTSQPWSACDRQKFLTITGTATIEPDSIGVSLKYDYNPITPLGTLLKISGAGTLRISDRTVMALNPFQDP